MAKAELRISPDLAFPVDVVTETLLIIAKRGSGKTHTASVLVEEMVRAGLPVCVIDPIGVWWGLRSSADGTGPGLLVTILGGEHADLPLPGESGARVADLIIDERIPVVIDLSGLSKTQQRKFVCDFMERLYHRNRDPLHLVVDEADLFAPLRGARESARLLGAYEDIVRRGRARGLGCTSITQRPAVLHTDIRSQAEVLIALRLIGTHDVAAIDEWVRLHATDEEAREVKASLPSLPVGTAWVWSPGWLEILARVKIRQRLTFDSSATPKVGQRRIIPRAFAPVDPGDLERLAAQLGESEVGGKDAVAAQADSSEVARLRRALAAATADLREAQARPAERVEVPTLAPGDVAALEQAITGLRDIAGSLELALGRAARPAPSVPKSAPGPIREVAETYISAPRPPASPPGEPAGLALGKAERTVLAVLAQFPEGCTRQQLAVLSGYSPTSLRNPLGRLRTLGLAGKGDPILITDAGRDTIGDDYDALPTGQALVQHWMSALGKAERTVLGILLDAWPAPVSRAELAERSGYSETSLRNPLGRLRTLDLVHDWTADETLARHAKEAQDA